MRLPSSFLAAVALSLCVCLLAACGKKSDTGKASDTSQLVGIWRIDGTTDRSIEFKADGTAQMRVRQSSEGPPAQWIVNKPGMVTFTFGTGSGKVARDSAYELKDKDDLVLSTPSSNTTARYRRVSFDDLKKFTPLPPQDWTYQDQMDAALGTTVRSATATSGELASGGTIDLVLRGRGPQGSVIELDARRIRQRFDCPKTCSFGVRFDDQAVVPYPVEASADGNAFIVVLKDHNALIGQMKSATKMRIDTKVEGEGLKPYEFKVAGLQWK